MTQLLPLELWDCVIDQLRNDLAALKTVSHICRTWYARTRYWLYKDIHISDCNASEFREILLQNPELGDYPRQLHICAQKTRPMGPVWRLPSPRLFYPPCIIMVLLPRITTACNPFYHPRSVTTSLTCPAGIAQLSGHAV
ncbi:hypothetical protein OBBRIDRAFT_824592, partial [Obba rivulosa]